MSDIHAELLINRRKVGKFAYWHGWRWISMKIACYTTEPRGHGWQPSHVACSSVKCKYEKKRVLGLIYPVLGGPNIPVNVASLSTFVPRARVIVVGRNDWGNRVGAPVVVVVWVTYAMDREAQGRGA